ncbi:MAG: hypothetical protein COA42_01905 [Alteromonadaceae bacterium]|nr:MAG: hypothetical protein COA42_01905 [Alteromonadaceae bacterium]
MTKPNLSPLARQLLSLMLPLSLFLLCTHASINVFASDHLDHIVNKNDAVADLTDFYVFPAPENPKLLAVIINSYPLVSSKGHFSDQITFRLVINKAELIQQDGGPALKQLKTVVINCNAEHGDDGDHLIMQCRDSQGMHAQAAFNVDSESNQQQFTNNDFPLYAGRRADLFFFNPLWIDSASNKGRILKPRDFNIIKGLNVLSIAMQLDPLKLFGDETLGMYALSVESVANDPNYSGQHRNARTIDRLGRAEMTNVTLFKENAKDLRPGFNQISTIDYAHTDMSEYRQRIVDKITDLDAIDKQRDWSDLQLQNAAKLFVDDYLTIDMRIPCTGETFLSLEMAWLKGEQHQNCGGRSIDDDIMDVLFTFYINQNTGQRYRDGSDHPQLAPSQEFPYFPAPTTGIFNWLKASILRLFI